MKIGLGTLLTVALTVLKLTAVITCAWPCVFVPMAIGCFVRIFSKDVTECC